MPLFTRKDRDTVPETTENYTTGLDVPDELAEHYPHGPLTEPEIVAAAGDAGERWLTHRKLAEIKADYERRGRPGGVFGGRDHHEMARQAARAGMTEDERRVFVHESRLDTAARAKRQHDEAVRSELVARDMFTCRVCNVFEHGRKLTDVKVAGRSARCCPQCATVLPVVAAEHLGVDTVDGATRRQLAARWLDVPR